MKNKFKYFKSTQKLKKSLKFALKLLKKYMEVSKNKKKNKLNQLKKANKQKFIKLKETISLRPKTLRRL